MKKEGEKYRETQVSRTGPTGATCRYCNLKVQGFKDKKRLLAYIFGTRHENLYTWVVSCAKSIRKGRGFEKSTGCCKMHKIYCKMCKNWYNSISK